MTWGNADDPVKRWRAEMDQLEQERAEAKAQMRRQEERHERSLARAGAREEIVELRGELATLYDTLRDVITATSDTLRTLGDEARTQRTAIDDLKLAVARLSATPEAKKAAFQFAREKGGGEVVDLPDFLASRRVN
jgi:chromosome segregation ATPase